VGNIIVKDGECFHRTSFMDQKICRKHFLQHIIYEFFVVTNK